MPRVKIIAAWPYMPKKRKVGEVFEVTQDKLKWWLQFTGNVREADWYEGIPESEMPEYIRFNHGKEIHKCEWRDGKVITYCGSWLATPEILCFYTPSNEGEYLKYKNDILLNDD